MGSAELERFRNRYGVGGAPAWLFFSSNGTYLCTARNGVFESDDDGVRLDTTVQAMLANPAMVTVNAQNCIGRKP